jgi:hypothetical protein
MDSFASNPIAQVLGFESDLPYAREVTLFLYSLHVLKHNKAGSNFVSTFLLTYVRAFGAMGFALPLVLGGLPSDIIKQMDDYAAFVVAAQIYNSFQLHKYLPGWFTQITSKLNSVAYYIVKGNLAGQGYVAAQAAIGDSTLAPFAGAYFAVQGHKFVEFGFQTDALKNKTFDEDGLLAVFGGLAIYLLGVYAETSIFMARVVLVVLRWSCEIIDWCDIYNQSVNATQRFITSATKKASSGKRSAMKGKRGRSRTPMRK